MQACSQHLAGFPHGGATRRLAQTGVTLLQKGSTLCGYREASSTPSLIVLHTFLFSLLHPAAGVSLMLLKLNCFTLAARDPQLDKQPGLVRKRPAD